MRRSSRRIARRSWRAPGPPAAGARRIINQTPASQASNELIKDRSALVAGDLVFFGRRGRVDHVGIYVGEGRFVHAPATGGTVKLDSLSKAYWQKAYLNAKRVLPTEQHLARNP